MPSGELRTLDELKREAQFLRNQLSSERKDFKAAIEGYEKRITISDAEKERAIMARDQTHELLVENKSDSIETLERVKKLQIKLVDLENENSQLVSELETTKLMLTDIQIKYNMCEKNFIHKSEQKTSDILREAAARHSAQIALMQQQVDNMKAKYDTVLHDNKNLDIRFNQLQRSRENIIKENSETVNQLTKNLENAQNQIHSLHSRTDSTQENKNLQSLIRILESEKDEMRSSITKYQLLFKEKSNKMESKSVQSELSDNNSMQLDVGLAKVKEELCKALSNLKSKSEEIKIYEKQIQEKDEEIRRARSDENKALVDLNHFRDDCIRMESKTKALECELSHLKSLGSQIPLHDSYVPSEGFDQNYMRQIQKSQDELELENMKKKYDKPEDCKNEALKDRRDFSDEKILNLPGNFKFFNRKATCCMT